MHGSFLVAYWASRLLLFWVFPHGQKAPYREDPQFHRKRQHLRKPLRYLESSWYLLQMGTRFCWRHRDILYPYSTPMPSHLDNKTTMLSLRYPQDPMVWPRDELRCSIVPNRTICKASGVIRTQFFYWMRHVELAADLFIERDSMERHTYTRNEKMQKPWIICD